MADFQQSPHIIIIYQGILRKVHWPTTVVQFWG